MTMPPPDAAARRLDPLGVRRTLKRAGLHASHARSQNFLADPDVLEAILVLADPGPGRRILEIGPGLGILTGGLLDAGAIVTAVELDRGLVAYLRDRFAGALAVGALTLIEGDALDHELTALVPPPYDVVANLPYHITSPILHRLLGAAPRPSRLVLMVQAEVAERIAAPPGRMSYLSVFVQYHAAVRIALQVPRDAFEPAPKVASSVIVLQPHDGRPAPSVLDGPAAARAGAADDEDRLWRLVQAGFRERRKMLRNVLVRQLPLTQSRIDAALEVAGIAGDRRPQTLAVDDWISLLGALG
jgi:16S rRNA (adenine1518-N6/adenine1519-N6)-dimethyltransferase